MSDHSSSTVTPTKRTERASRWILGVVILLILVGVVVALAFRSQAPQLLSRARFVFDKSQLKLKPRETVEMISDHELLVYSISASSNKLIYSIQKLDTATGKRESLRKLERLFDKTHAIDGTLSPNGEWMKWTAGDGLEHASRLDATEHFAWQTVKTAWMGGNWSTDGSAWLSPYISSTQTIDLATTWDDRFQLAFPQQKQVVQEGNTVRASPVARGYIHNGWSALPGPVIRCVVDDPDLPSAGLTVLNLDASHGLKVLRKYQIPIPITSHFDECLLSQNGQSLVSVSSELVRPLWRKVLGTFIHSFRKPTEVRATMWASRFDGINLRAIGYVGSTGSHNSIPTELKWFTNNKIGFELDGKYYTIDVGK